MTSPTDRRSPPRRTLRLMLCALVPLWLAGCVICADAPLLTTTTHYIPAGQWITCQKGGEGNCELHLVSYLGDRGVDTYFDQDQKMHTVSFRTGPLPIPGIEGQSIEIYTEEGQIVLGEVFAQSDAFGIYLARCDNDRFAAHADEASRVAQLRGTLCYVSSFDAYEDLSRLLDTGDPATSGISIAFVQAD